MMLASGRAHEVYVAVCLDRVLLDRVAHFVRRDHFGSDNSIAHEAVDVPGEKFLKQIPRQDRDDLVLIGGIGNERPEGAAWIGDSGFDAENEVALVDQVDEFGIVLGGWRVAPPRGRISAIDSVL